MTHDCAPGTDALADEPGPEVLARVLRALRELPAARVASEESAEAPGERPDVPLPRRR